MSRAVVAVTCSPGCPLCGFEQGTFWWWRRRWFIFGPRVANVVCNQCAETYLARPERITWPQQRHYFPSCGLEEHT